MKKLFFILILLFSQAVPPQIAFSQVSTNALQDLNNENAPIEISGDRLEIIDSKKQLIYFGNVKIVRATSTIETEKLVLHYKQQGQPQEMERLEFIGQVMARDENNTISASKATYNVANEQIILEGDVVAQNGENKAEGCMLIVNLLSNITELKACGESVNTTINTNNLNGETNE